MERRLAAMPEVRADPVMMAAHCVAHTLPRKQAYSQRGGLTWTGCLQGWGAVEQGWDAPAAVPQPSLCWAGARRKKWEEGEGATEREHCCSQRLLPRHTAPLRRWQCLSRDVSHHAVLCVCVPL